MNKLCFSSFAKILISCKAAAATQFALGEVLLCTIAPFYANTITDDRVSAVVNGRDNLPPDVLTEALSTINYNVQKTFASELKTKLLPLLDNNKKALIALALKNLIENDDEIQNDTIIEMVNGITKEQLLARDTFVFDELLTGILLYVAAYVANKGTNAYAKTVTPEFIQSFDSQRAYISFISQYANLDHKELRDIRIDTHSLVLLTETEGHCLRCGKPLAISNDGREVDNSSVVTMPDGDECLMCVACARLYASMTPTEKTELLNKKRKLASQATAREAASKHDLDARIDAVIREISGLDISIQTKLRDEPLMVEQKISETRLLREVLADVQENYNGVRTSMLRASGENRLNINVFERNVRRIYEDVKDNFSSQREIYDFMVDKLYEMSGHKYRDACAILVSCFVQRCEVFDEITE